MPQAPSRSSSARAWRLLTRLRAGGQFQDVIGFTRSSDPGIELLDEVSLERAAAFAAAKGELRLVIDATGSLHDDRQGPEKSRRQLDSGNLARSFAINAGRASCFRDAVRQSRKHRRQSSWWLVLGSPSWMRLMKSPNHREAAIAGHRQNFGFLGHGQDSRAVPAAAPRLRRCSTRHPEGERTSCTPTATTVRRFRIDERKTV